MSQAQAEAATADLHEDDVHARNPALAHHFDTPRHQFEAGKLGIWLFLITEVLFFAGLLCAYTVYRSQHPEVFRWAHHFLDWKLGAINTLVLLASSLTAAAAVRFAQLGQRNALLAAIVLTVVGAFGFLGIKYVEYSHKFHDGLLPGSHFAPHEEAWETEAFSHKHPAAAKLAKDLSAWFAARDPNASKTDKPVMPDGLQAQLRNTEATRPLMEAGVIGNPAWVAAEGMGRPKLAHVFFSVYFLLTGLHGIHVVAGIIVWLWLLRRAVAGEFGPRFFGPVDYGALYWHLVDLVWIYLFPLLYLVS
ncbi:MAG TPA: cytochrome c oxidase subunit 3 [Polyangiaceae bacterium]